LLYLSSILCIDAQIGEILLKIPIDASLIDLYWRLRLSPQALSDALLDDTVEVWWAADMQAEIIDTEASLTASTISTGDPRAEIPLTLSSLADLARRAVGLEAGIGETEPSFAAVIQGTGDQGAESHTLGAPLRVQAAELITLTI